MLGDDDRSARWRLRRTSRNPLPADALPLLNPDVDSDTVIDLDDEDVTEEIVEAPVHSHLPDRPAPREPLLERDRNPIVQKLWTDPVDAALAKLEFAWHVALFHGARLHRYLGRAIAWTPQGVGRMIIGLWRWWNDSESAPLRHATAERGDVAGYLAVSRQRNERVHDRKWFAMLGIAAVLSAPFAAGAATVAGLSAGQWSLTVLGLTIGLSYVGTAGWYGAPADRRLIEAATTETGARRITGEMLRTAFEAAKLTVPAQGKDIEFVRDVARVGRHGQEAVIDLPPGKTFEQAFKKRAEIASGLSVARVQVFMTADSESERRVKIYVHDTDPYATNPPVTPLAKRAKVDFWQPFPIGIDARGQTVDYTLIWTSLLIGSIPRQGKTNALRLPLAAAALDPTVRIIAFNGKGDRALKPVERIAHRYGSGVREPVVAHLAAVLRECVADMDTRMERMSGMSDKDCPDDKVTPELTADRSLDMPLTVIAIDEVHRYLEHDDWGDQILDSLTELAKVGPSAGYMLLIATQKPDADVIKDKLRGQFGSRAALKVMTWQASDTILGAGSYSAGLDASQFAKSHKGVAILLGTDDNELSERGGQIVRFHLCNGVTFQQICDRSHELRSRLGLLTGLAAGEDVMAEHTPWRMLDDILDVFGVGEDRLWSETICERLAQAYPGSYDGWTPANLATALRPHGVKPEQIHVTVDGERRNRRGFNRDDIVNALAKRLETASRSGGNGDTP